jgi:hypothetical protein
MQDVEDDLSISPPPVHTCQPDVPVGRQIGAVSARHTTANGGLTKKCGAYRTRVSVPRNGILSGRDRRPETAPETKAARSRDTAGEKKPASGGHFASFQEISATMAGRTRTRCQARSHRTGTPEGEDKDRNYLSTIVSFWRSLTRGWRPSATPCPLTAA